ncbi:MAG: hypothetical protein QF848_12220 [Planctomycetota bacterium]|nr:hypothetical protein [Planctomycetota bacterium]
MGDKGRTGRVAGRQLCAPMIGVFLTLGLVGCKGLDTQDDLSVGASFSALPNLGLALAAAQVFKSDDARTWAFEIEATHQPWDDEALARDGNPAAGPWTQFQMGTKRVSQPSERRHSTRRYGLTWFRAGDDPNIVQVAGDYIGLYASMGFESEFSETLSMGPEFTLIAARMEGDGGDLVVVPQINWHLSWGF